MPWQDEIDEIRPQDTEFVSEGAMRFRELKRALIERFSTAYKGFPEENPDREGEALLFPIASVRVGTDSQRPETPEREGAGWFSTDTGQLWVSNRDLAWQKVGVGEGGSGGVPGAGGAPYIQGVTLASRTWGGGGNLRAVGLLSEPEGEAIRSLRSINFRVFINQPWNGRYGHGTNSLVMYPDGSSGWHDFRLEHVASSISSTSRLYHATIHHNGSFSGDVEIEIQWSFWDNVQAPEFPDGGDPEE